jgi:hypothetical protein
VLARAQQQGAVRPDLTTADLTALLSGLLLALHPAGHHAAADPDRALAVLLAGLRAT